MAGYAGKLVLLKIEGTTPGTFEAVMSAKSNSFSINHSVIDTTTKADAGWDSKLSGGGITSFETSLSGTYLGTVLDKKLQGYAFTGEEFLGEIVTGDGSKYEGTFLITKADTGGEFDGVQTYNYSIVNVGPIEFTPAP